MRRRTVILGMSVVAMLAPVLPATAHSGPDSDLSAEAVDTSKRADEPVWVGRMVSDETYVGRATDGPAYQRQQATWDLLADGSAAYSSTFTSRFNTYHGELCGWRVNTIDSTGTGTANGQVGVSETGDGTAAWFWSTFQGVSTISATSVGWACVSDANGTRLESNVSTSTGWTPYPPDAQGIGCPGRDNLDLPIQDADVQAIRTTEQFTGCRPNDSTIIHVFAFKKSPCDQSIDTDSDGLVDCLEFDLFTDTLKKDTDDDGVMDGQDACPLEGGDVRPDGCPVDTPDEDSDGDGVLDRADNCPLTPNADQSNLDADGLGNACDPDIDGDGLSNNEEDEAGTNPYNPDSDADTVKDGDDDCPVVFGANDDGCPVAVATLGLLVNAPPSATFVVTGALNDVLPAGQRTKGPVASGQPAIVFVAAPPGRMSVRGVSCSNAAVTYTEQAERVVRLRVSGIGEGEKVNCTLGYERPKGRLHVDARYPVRLLQSAGSVSGVADVWTTGWTADVARICWTTQVSADVRGRVPTTIDLFWNGSVAPFLDTSPFEIIGRRWLTLTQNKARQTVEYHRQCVPHGGPVEIAIPLDLASARGALVRIGWQLRVDLIQTDGSRATVLLEDSRKRNGPLDEDDTVDFFAPLT